MLFIHHHSFGLFVFISFALIVVSHPSSSHLNSVASNDFALDSALLSIYTVVCLFLIQTHITHIPSVPFSRLVYFPFTANTRKCSITSCFVSRDFNKRTELKCDIAMVTAVYAVLIFLLLCELELASTDPAAVVGVCLRPILSS